MTTFAKMAFLCFGNSRVEIPAGTRLVIGRDRNVQLHVNDPHISRAHASIEGFGDDSLLLADLGSVNGIQVQGERIPWALLGQGGEFSMGVTHFKVEF